MLNASGKDGAAGEALDALKQNGFEGAGTDNSAQPFQASEVHYRAGDEGAAALVASFVTGPVQIVEKDSIPGGDVTLYIGRAFTGIGAAAVPVSLAPIPGGC